jgi:ankyrin repeat protein
MKKKRMLSIGANYYILENNLLVPIDKIAKRKLDFMIASQKGNLNKVKHLVNLGVDIHLNEEYAFLIACEMGHLDLVEYFTALGANVYIQDDWALVLAVENNHLKVVKYLVNLGLDVTEECLNIALKKKYLDIYEYLKKKK